MVIIKVHGSLREYELSDGSFIPFNYKDLPRELPKKAIDEINQKSLEQVQEKSTKRKKRRGKREYNI